MIIFSFSIQSAAVLRPQDPAYWERIPVPEGARVILKANKERYFVGEDIVVQFVLENTGLKPFRIMIGGNRCADSRDMSFRITVKDESGRRLWDPMICRRHCTYSREIPQWREVKPGGKYAQTLHLHKYFMFEKPGTYSISISSGLGWAKAKDREHPVGNVKLHIVMPPGKKVVLRRPPTPESTKEMIELLNHPQKRIVLQHASQLMCRLPDPDYEVKPSRQLRASGCCEIERPWKAEHSWRPEFARPALEGAKKMLTWRDLNGMEYAAFIIGYLGGEKELPSLIDGLDYVLGERKYTPYDTYSDLLGAAEMLVCKGVKAPESPGSPGEAAVFLAAIKAREDFRPKDWVATARRLLQHKLFYIRQLALKSLPRPVDRQFLDLVVKSLEDSEYAVRREAIFAAESIKSPELKEHVFKVLETSNNEKILGQALRVAKSLDLLPEALLAIANRFNEPRTASMCNNFMAYTINRKEIRGFYCHGQISPENARQLKARWTSFLKAHMEDIRSGRRYVVGDPELTPDLIPEGCGIVLDSGERWPSRVTTNPASEH